MCLRLYLWRGRFIHELYFVSSWVQVSNLFNSRRVKSEKVRKLVKYFEPIVKETVYDPVKREKALKKLVFEFMFWEKVKGNSETRENDIRMKLHARLIEDGWDAALLGPAISFTFFALRRRNINLRDDCSFMETLVQIANEFRSLNLPQDQYIKNGVYILSPFPEDLPYIFFIESGF